MNSHRFTVGSSYENEKGTFKVLAIKGESMLIEWDSGERITTSVALQERILNRIEKEANAPAGRKGAASPVWMGKSFAGLQHGDFKDNVDGTHWRSREQLGGAVARLIESSAAFNSWSVYRRPEIHWAAIGRYRVDAPWVQAKFFIRLSDESAIFGYYIERSDNPDDPRVDWLSFLNWLAAKSHTAWLHQTLTGNGMRIFDPYPQFEGAFNRSISPVQDGWLMEAPEVAPKTIDLNSLADHLTAVKEGKWLNLLIGRVRPANEIIASGTNVAGVIATDFNTLLPLYLNKDPRVPQSRL